MRAPPAGAYGAAMSYRRLLSMGCLASAAIVACPGVAGAAGWSNPAVLEARCAKGEVNCAIETSPRIAVNARGESVVAWIDKDRVRVATGDGRGRFSRGVTFEKAFRPAVSITADGVAAIVWSKSGQLRYAWHVPGRGFSSPANLVPRGSKLGDDMPKAAIQPDGSTLVLYETATRTPATGYVTELRSVRIRRGPRPTKPTVIGRGSVARDGFGAASDGRVAACCTGDLANHARPATVAAYAPAGGWAILAPPLRPGQDVESVGVGRGDVVLGTVDVAHSGDVGVSGRPGLVRADSRGTFGAPLAAPVVRPGLAFGPVAAVDTAGRSVLVYQEKSAPKAFSRLAPLWAVTARLGGTFGARRSLDKGLARFPQMRAYRAGAIVVWEAPNNRWGLALERDGRFEAGPTPAGGPSAMGEDFIRSRDIATAGRYAALAWTAKDGSVRASIAASL